MLVSRGDLTGPWNAAVSSTVANTIHFSWTDNSNSGTAQDTDNAILLVYNPVQNEFVVLENTAKRGDASEDMIVAATYAGNTVHCWMAFVSANKKSISTSVYVGEVAVV